MVGNNEIREDFFTITQSSEYIKTKKASVDAGFQTTSGCSM